MTTELLAWLIDATLATSLAAIAVLLLRKPLQRVLGAEIAYRLWIVIPLATIGAGFSLPHTVPVAQGVAPVAMVSASPVVVRVISTVRSVASDRWLLAAWLFGACAVLALFFWQQRRFIARLRLHRDAAGVWRSGVSDATPSVLGVLRQKLVLPANFETDYNVEEQSLVLAHERMHQRRRDPWALALSALLRTLFWFNPIVQFAATRFRRDVELACDAAVLRTQPVSRQRYATALLKAHIAAGALPVGCLWNRTPPMKERIMLLKQAVPACTARLAGAILVALAAIGATGLALAGHDSAQQAADALAARADDHAPFYQIALDMSVDGKPVAHPAVIARAGDEAMVKVDENGKAWGLKFRVTPAAGLNGKAMHLAGDVFTGDEQHVIGRPQLGLKVGTPGVIELNDPHAATTRPIYRIAATITPMAAPPAPPSPPVPPPPMPPGTALAPPPPPVSAEATMAPLPPLPPLPPEAVMAPLPLLPPLPPKQNAYGRRVIVTIESKHGVATPPPPPPPMPPLPPDAANAPQPPPPPEAPTPPPSNH